MARAVAQVTTTLKDVAVPGDRGQVRAILTNLGTTDIKTTVPLIVELLDEGDSAATITTFDAKVSLKPGRSVTIRIPISINLDWPQEQSNISVRFDGAPLADENQANDRAADARLYEVRHQFGNVDGRAGSTRLSFNQGEQIVTLSLSGRDGLGEVSLDDDGRIKLELTGTTLSSSAKLTVKGGNRTAELAQVTIEDDLRSFSANTANLQGDFFAGGLLHSLTLNHVSDSEIVVAGVGTARQKLAVALGQVSESSLNAGMIISSLKAIQWLDEVEVAAIVAPSLGSLAIAGDFEADLHLSDTTSRTALNKADIKGNLRDATWRLASHVGTIKAAAIFDSAILLGLKESADPGLLDADDFLRDLLIRSLTVTGHREAPQAPAVVDFLLAASRIGSLRLARIDAGETEQPHGIVASTIDVVDLTLAPDGTRFQSRRQDDQATLDEAMAGAGWNAGDFAVTLLDLPQFAPPPAIDVAPTAETVPVPSSGDAADDIAIWVDPQDPTASLILGTNKAGSRNSGIFLYDLQGQLVGSASSGQRINNIDLRYGMMHEGESVDVVAATNRTQKSVDLFIVDPQSRSLIEAGSIPLGGDDLNNFGEAYGLTMHHDRDSDRYFVFVSDKSGRIAQFELLSAGGRIIGERVRYWKESSVVEGMVVDDVTGHLFVGEETRGIYRYDAVPGTMTSSPLAGPPPVDRVLVDDMSGPLDADVEGLAIYRTGAGNAYLLASSQGSNRYVIYDAATFRRLAVLRIIPTADGLIDGTSDTDGIEALAGNLGPDYPLGVFVAQDGSNSGGQNYKIISWADVMAAAQQENVTLEGDGLFDPRA